MSNRARVHNPTCNGRCRRTPPGGRVNALRDLVHVTLGGQARADVQELGDPRLGDQVTYRRRRNLRFSTAISCASGAASLTGRAAARSAAKLS